MSFFWQPLNWADIGRKVNVGNGSKWVFYNSEKVCRFHNLKFFGLIVSLHGYVYNVMILSIMLRTKKSRVIPPTTHLLIEVHIVGEGRGSEESRLRHSFYGRAAPSRKTKKMPLILTAQKFQIPGKTSDTFLLLVGLIIKR